jgi:hypothetical protein
MLKSMLGGGRRVDALRPSTVIVYGEVEQSHQSDRAPR